jgi:uncharacterized iron-regulated membrane protein
VEYRHTLDQKRSNSHMAGKCPNDPVDDLQDWCEQLGMRSEQNAKWDRRRRSAARGLAREAEVEPKELEVFVDPYSGTVLGVRERGKFALDKHHLIPFLYRFHFTLHASSMGAWLMGIVALVWFLDCFVGTYLTFPRGRPLSSGLRYLRAIFARSSVRQSSCAHCSTWASSSQTTSWN